MKNLALMALTCLPAISAVTAIAVRENVDLSAFSNNTDATQGTPALYTHIWTGLVNTEHETLYGNSVDVCPCSLCPFSPDCFLLTEEGYCDPNL